MSAGGGQSKVKKSGQGGIMMGLVPAYEIGNVIFISNELRESSDSDSSRVREEIGSWVVGSVQVAAQVRSTTCLSPKMLSPLPYSPLLSKSGKV